MTLKDAVPVLHSISSADALGVTTHTVKLHLANLFRKFDVSHRRGLPARRSHVRETWVMRSLARAARPTREHRLERVVAGLNAQLERAPRFDDSVDLAAAVAAHERIVRLLEPQLGALRHAAGLPVRPRPFARPRWRRACRIIAARTAVPRAVYTYWDSPLSEAPPLVRACVARLAALHPTLRVLDGAAARELIDIPERISTLLEHDRPAHFSDYVRTAVLARHGGVWVDATVWLGRNLDADLPRYLRSGTVFPRWTGRRIANWFIVSQPHTPIIELQRLALEAWWEANDDLPDYFLFHRIFEVLSALVPEFRGQWDATPHLSATAAHLLQLGMMQPAKPEATERMLRQAPVQKLSYKYDTVPPGSTLELLLRTGGDAQSLKA